MQLRKFEPYFLATLGLVGCCWFAGAVLFELVSADVLESRPWSIVQYAGYSDLPVYWIAVAAGVAPPLVLGLLMIIPKKESLHGNAKWATARDVEKAGMRAKGGILLGRFRGKYLSTNEASHFLVCAPTRSGKGVGVIIPNLLSFDGSTIIHDIKLENWEKTSGFRRAHGHKVFLWSPMNPDGRTHSYNPLDRIRDDALFRLSDAQSLASHLIPLPKKDPIWDQLARFLFTALILYTLDRAREEDTPATLGEIYRTLGDHADLQAWAMETSTLPWLDPECRRLLLSFAGMTDKERSFVRTSIAKCLNLWSNPLVDAATSRSDFDLGDLRRKRMAIYLGVTTDTQEAVAPLVALFFQQAIAALTQREPGKDEPHKVLFLMDEFASLGRMSLIANAVTMLASYGGRLMFILQALSTLDEHYGKEGREVILQNCAFQVFFAASDETTTRYVTSRLGKKTVKSTSRTQSKGGVSRSTSEQARDLMLPQEFQQLDRGKEVVLVEAARPVLGDKIVYHKDERFQARLLKAPPVPKVEIEGRHTAVIAVEAKHPGPPSKAARDFAAGKKSLGKPAAPAPETTAPSEPGIEAQVEALIEGVARRILSEQRAAEGDRQDEKDGPRDADENTSDTGDGSGTEVPVAAGITEINVATQTAALSTAYDVVLGIDGPTVTAKQAELRAMIAEG